MKSRRADASVRVSFTLLCGALLAGAASAAPARPSASAGAVSAARASTRADVTRWNARLEQLDPLRPMDYLELGEEVADGATSAEERSLARQLFGLAGALDSPRLGRSAMLAIAALAEDEPARVRARAAAELVGGRGGAGGGAGGRRVDGFGGGDALVGGRSSSAVGANDVLAEAQIEALSRSFSFYRRGDGRRALMALGQSGADALLDAIGPQLPGGAEAYRAECRAMRTGGAMPFDSEMIRRQLEIELALRRGEARELSLDVALRGDVPLLEIDLADPRALWGVDAARAWWRGGEWRAES